MIPNVPLSPGVQTCLLRSWFEWRSDTCAFSQHCQAILSRHWMECPRNLTQCWHYLPGDNIRPHRARPQTHFRCQLQGQVATCAPVWLHIGGSHSTLLWFHYFAGAADGTQRNAWFCWPVYYKEHGKGIQRASQMKRHTCVSRSRKAPRVGASVPVELDAPPSWPVDAFTHLEAYQLLLMFTSFCSPTASPLPFPVLGGCSHPLMVSWWPSPS